MLTACGSSSNPQAAVEAWTDRAKEKVEQTVKEKVYAAINEAQATASEAVSYTHLTLPTT